MVRFLFPLVVVSALSFSLSGCLSSNETSSSEAASGGVNTENPSDRSPDSKTPALPGNAAVRSFKSTFVAIDESLCQTPKIEIEKADQSTQTYASVQEAILAAVEGDTIFVQTKGDLGDLDFTGKKGIKLASLCGASYSSVRIEGSENLELIGLLVNAYNQGKHGVFFSSKMKGNTGIKITDCEIQMTDRRHSGVRIGSKNQQIELNNCYIHNNKAAGVVIGGSTKSSITIKNSTIAQNLKSGIQLNSKTPITLENVIISGNGRQADESDGGFGIRVEDKSLDTPANVTLTNVRLGYNRGKIETAADTQDIANFAKILDETDFGVVTTSGVEVGATGAVATLLSDTVAPILSSNLTDQMTVTDSQLDVRVLVDEDMHQVTTVSVNGREVAFGNAHYLWSRVSLKNGANQIRIRAEDRSGNVSLSELVVNSTASDALHCNGGVQRIKEDGTKVDHASFFQALSNVANNEKILIHENVTLPFTTMENHFGVTIETNCEVKVQGMLVHGANKLNLIGLSVDSSDQDHALYFEKSEERADTVLLSDMNLKGGLRSALRVENRVHHVRLVGSSVSESLGNGVRIGGRHGSPTYLVDNRIENHAQNGVTISGRSFTRVTGNLIRNNGLRYKKPSSSGYGLKFGNQHTLSDGTVVEMFSNTLVSNNGKPEADRSSSDIGFFHNIGFSAGSGNVSSTGEESAQIASYPVTLPELTIVSKLKAKTLESSYSLEYTVNCSGCTSEVLVNGVSQVSSTDATVTSSLSLTEGLNKLRFVLTQGDDVVLLERNIRLDTTPPVMTLGAIPATTSAISLSVEVSFVDATTVKAKVYRNGELLKKFNSKASVVNLDLHLGTNDFRIEYKDGVGLSGPDEVFSIVRGEDSVAPVVNLLTVVPQAQPSSELTLSYQVVEDNLLNSVVELNGALVGQFTESYVSLPMVLVEGPNVITVRAIDLAGNVSEDLLIPVHVDTVHPVLSSNLVTPLITNQPSLNLDLSAVDESALVYRVFLNGALHKETSDLAEATLITLSEGSNVASVTATDVAGNVSQALFFDSMVLDTVPPIVTTTPETGTIVNGLSFQVDMGFSEPLSSLTINGQSLPVTQTSYTYMAEQPGLQTITIEAADALGNVGTKTLQITAAIEALRSSLVSVVPDPVDPGKLFVKGAQGAVNPFTDVTVIASGVSTTGKANAAGSFAVETNNFVLAEVRVFNEFTGETESATVSYSPVTTLSGCIKDSQNNLPIEGAKIYLNGSTEFVLTDSNGIFSIQPDQTGDRELVIDPTDAMIPSNASARKYNKLVLELNLGRQVSNVIPSTIFLNPTLLDGSAALVNKSVGQTVTSVHAPGVTLEIPPNTVSFPENVDEALVSLSMSAPDRTTMPLPGFATFKVDGSKPIVNLEPSGVTFSEPVPVTLPNPLEFPAGTQMVIMSLDSRTGKWGADGVAEVTEDGSQIKTKEGSGITHFSQIYPLPVGLTIFPRDSKEDVGTGIENNIGALERTIDLPTIQSMGREFAPKLVYNSTWAHPNAVIRNYLDITEADIKVEEISEEGEIEELKTKVTKKVCVIGFCWDKYEDYYQAYRDNVEGTITHAFSPEYVATQFFINGQSTEKSYFQPFEGKAVLAYSVDFDNGLGVPTGLYNSFAAYEVFYRNMILRNYILERDVLAVNINRVPVPHISKEIDNVQDLSLVIPGSIKNTLYVRNEKNSAFGAGWTFAGLPKIFDDSGARIAVDDGSGRISYYSLDNTLETPYDFAEVNDDRIDHGVLLDNYPDLNYFSYKSPYTYEYNQASGQSASSQTTLVSDFRALNGRIEKCAPPPDGCSISINYLWEFKRDLVDLVRHPSGWVFAADKQSQQIVGIGQNGDVVHSELRGQRTGNSGWDLAECSNFFGTPCGPSNQAGSEYHPWPLGNDGDQFSRPSGVDLRPGSAGRLLVSDTGNNVIKEFAVDPATGAITYLGRFAGDMSNFHQFGLPASNSSIPGPVSVSFDVDHNSYILTESGVVIKAIYDQNNLTEHFAGHIGAGGQFEETRRTAINILEGHTIKVGPDGKWVYVSDREGHRVLRMSVENDYVEVIAGTGNCEVDEDILSGLPTEISLCFPTHIDFDSDGNLLIVDSGHNRLRRLIFNRSDLGTTRFVSEARDASSIVRKADGTLNLIGPNGTVSKFDDQNRYIGSLGRDGRSLDVQYDGDKIESISDNEGQLLRFGYNGDKVDAIIDRANRSTRLEVDPLDNHLSLVRLPDNTTRKYEYDAKAHLRREKDQLENETEYLYNKFGRLARIIYPDESETVISLADEGTSLNGYTDDQEPLQVAALASDDGPVDVVTRGVGAQTKVRRDYLGRVDQILDPNNRRTEIFYNRFDQVTKLVDPSGQSTTFDYDDLGRQIEQRNETTGRFLKTAYNDFNQVLTQEDNDGELASYTYDSSGNQLTATNRSGLDSVRTYFSNGLLNSETLKDAQAGDITRSFTYDGNGNLQTVLINGAQKQSFVRDNAGNPLTTTSASSNETVRTYDGFNRLLSVRSPENQMTSYRYIDTGQLSEVEDPSSRVVQFRYDVMGRLQQREDHLGRQTTYQYDDSGNVIQLVDPAGHVTNMEYDLAGQLLKRTLEDNTYLYEYDELGNLVGVENDEAFAQFTYDNDGRLLFESLRGRSIGLMTHEVSYEYDQISGNLLEMAQTYNGQQYLSSFGYTDNVLTTIDAPNSMRFNYEYNDALQLTRFDRVDTSVVTSRYDYDLDGHLISSMNGVGANSRDFSYSRDQDDDITRFVNAGLVREYAYDDNKQLTSVREGSSLSVVESFTYDDVGNRVLEGATSYSYEGEKFYLKSDGIYNYSYDLNGNLKSKIHNVSGVIESFEYTSENRLKRYVKSQSVAGPILIEADYAYGPVGRRIEKKVIDHGSATDVKKSRTIRYLYVGEEPSIEVNINNELLAYHAYSGLQADDVLGTYVTPAGVTYGYAPQPGNYYFYKDHLGSVRYVTDSSGSVVQTIDYSSYGKVSSVKDSVGAEVGLMTPVFTLNHAYTGREFDSESGFYYYRARTYDPSSGRFLQEDPYQGTLDAPLTVFNRYKYAMNNPLNFTDPSGECEAFCVSFLVTIGVTVISSLINYATEGGGGDYVQIGVGFNEEGRFNDVYFGSNGAQFAIPVRSGDGSTSPTGQADQFTISYNPGIFPSGSPLDFASGYAGKGAYDDIAINASRYLFRPGKGLLNGGIPYLGRYFRIGYSRGAAGGRYPSQPVFRISIGNGGKSSKHLYETPGVYK